MRHNLQRADRNRREQRRQHDPDKTDPDGQDTGDRVRRYEIAISHRHSCNAGKVKACQRVPALKMTDGQTQPKHDDKESGKYWPDDVQRGQQFFEKPDSYVFHRSPNTCMVIHMPLLYAECGQQRLT